MKTSDEQIDYYSEAGDLLGFCSRQEAEARNYITANVIMFIFDESGNIWLQKRADHKKHYPGLWDASACGSITHGEDALTAAGRELAEETGLTCQLHFVETFRNSFPDETQTLIRTRLSHLYVGVASEIPQGNHEVHSFSQFLHSDALKTAREHPEQFVPSIALELEKAIAKYTALPL